MGATPNQTMLTQLSARTSRTLSGKALNLGTWERVEYIYGFSIGEREGA
jgi:hypothetical protein